ncbi:MAG TPA: HEPN domain-containing protein, partial [Nitrospira sp.]|nr:HEPN domain-containing protein [Nitrospira sp.]
CVILTEAEASLEQGHFHRTIRKCQESVEMALKGLLRVAGIEYPKAHRVGRVLVESAVAQVVPAERLRDIARIADELADAREEAFYGSESSSAAELFTRNDATDALSKAKTVETFVAELVHRYIRP